MAHGIARGQCYLKGIPVPFSPLPTNWTPMMQLCTDDRSAARENASANIHTRSCQPADRSQGNLRAQLMRRRDTYADIYTAIIVPRKLVNAVNTARMNDMSTEKE